MELMQASNQWASRPADQRFTSLTALVEHCEAVRDRSRQLVVSSRKVEALPTDASNPKSGLLVGIEAHNGIQASVQAPTNWSFGQLSALAGAPAGYLRTLPAALASDCVNVGLLKRNVQEIGALIQEGDEPQLTAATGPGYGRVWNATVSRALYDRFGDGVTSQFRVPGEFGKPVPVTVENTTLYASDRDMFVFLADETHGIEIANRRNGQTGAMSRGFFVWNSEVGSQTLGIATFLFDYVCCNRIVWGASDFKELRVRHTSGAPDRWVEEITPAIQAYANSPTASITSAIADAQAKRIGDAEEVTAFLANRKFTRGQIDGIKAAHVADEGRPIETIWDAATGITAYARGVTHQDARVDLERAAGKVLALAA